MSRFFFNLYGVLFLVALFPALAQAQRCETDYELIFEMRDAEIGSYNVWDTVLGEQDKQERFASAVSLGPQGTVVAGERFVFEEGDVKLVIVHVDRRGRLVWERAHGIKGLRKVIKILPVHEGYAVFGNRQGAGGRSEIWVGFFGNEGRMINGRSIESREGGLNIHDVIKARDGSGFIVAASVEPSDGAAKPYGLFYKLDKTGGVLQDRSYVTGLENRILGLRALGNHDYVATGYIYGEDGRKTGWVIRLDRQGSIVWQRQYPRGRAAQLNVTHSLLNRFVVVAGDAHPAGGGNIAGWVMALDPSNGNIGWQRYYSGELDYQVRDMVANEDGLISLLLDGDPPDGETKKDYVRLLTINPRGFLFIADEYFNAEGADAYQLILGPVGERIIVGRTKMVYRIEGQGESDEVELKRSLDGWLVAATATEPYKDPCLQPYSFLP